jgi:PAS domain S-box-containing protein
MKTESAAGVPDPAIEKKLIGWILIALVVVALMIAAAVQNNARYADGITAVNRTRAFIQETDAILSSLRAAEAAQRAYLVTADDATKNIAAEHFAVVDGHLKTATTLAFENAAQLDRLGPIATLLQKRIDLNKEAGRLMVRGMALFTTAEARADLRDLEQRVAANRTLENRLSIDHEQMLQRHTRRTEQILYAGGGLIVILLGLAFAMVRRDLQARRNAAALADERLRERGAELDALTDKWQLENLEKRWGQAALERVVGHHELVVNSIGEGVFVVSKNGQIIAANPAAADLTRREVHQLAGKSIGSVLLDGDRLPFPWEKHFLRSALKNGQPVPTKPATVKQADGSLVDVQLACHPTRDQENLTGAVITVARNYSPMQ